MPADTATASSAACSLGLQRYGKTMRVLTLSHEAAVALVNSALSPLAHGAPVSQAILPRSRCVPTAPKTPACPAGSALNHCCVCSLGHRPVGAASGRFQEPSPRFRSISGPGTHACLCAACHSTLHRELRGRRGSWHRTIAVAGIPSPWVHSACWASSRHPSSSEHIQQDRARTNRFFNKP